MGICGCGCDYTSTLLANTLNAQQGSQLYFQSLFVHICVSAFVFLLFSTDTWAAIGFNVKRGYVYVD
jgi:hypothetical protein